MDEIDSQRTIEDYKHGIWEETSLLQEKPIYPAIVQKMLITAHEEEYFDHDLEYEERYTEWLELREGFIVAALAEKSDLLGIGDAVILDIEKHVLMRTPRVMRCGLELPMISYQGCTCQPQDYITYFEDMLAQVESYKDSLNKKSLRY